MAAAIIMLITIIIGSGLAVEEEGAGSKSPGSLFMRSEFPRMGFSGSPGSENTLPLGISWNSDDPLLSRVGASAVC
jgi:hypothetical protein